MTNPAITVEGISKSFRIYNEHNQSLKATILRRKRSVFKEFLALDDVSFEIPEGGTFGLMGHNGSGKSTLLKCIAGILSPNKGRTVAYGSLAAMLELGSGFHPDLTGRENIYLNGSILGMSKKTIDSRFEEIVEFAGIGAFIDQPVKSYSSGMYVRLGFSVAIHVQPDILLVDEILAVGDMQFQEKCKDKFADFRRQGRTVVVVSHGLGDMRTFCDLAAWLDHGKLVEVGQASRIVDRYIEAVHGAKPVDSGGVRDGSGGIQINKVELLTEAGIETRSLATGDPMHLRLHWQAEMVTTDPVITVSVYSKDGQHLWSHSAKDAGCVPASLYGAGSVEVTIPALPLLPGTYEVHTSITDFDVTECYDRWSRAITFDVRKGRPYESAGYVAMGATWGNLTPPTAMSFRSG